jgi:GAF domain-containing protein
MAAVSLVDQDRQWFLSRVGLQPRQTPRGMAFCGHAVAERRMLHVVDAGLDPRFAANPLVIGPPYIRAYLAVPLMDGAGHVLGTLCVLDQRPRRFSTQEQHLMLRYGKALERLIAR